MDPKKGAAIQIKYTKINLKGLQFDQGDNFHGRGQYGDVKKAKWNGKVVAVKSFDSADRKGGFSQEIVCLSLLQSHENIVIMHGACNCAKPFIVLEFAPLSLEKVLHEHKKMYWYNADHMMSWSLQTAVGLEYIHSKEMLHRDIKPSNILLFHHGRKLKLCDFGTARKLEHTLTDAVGTIRYMAPEVIQGTNYSDRCDVFSYGVVLWEMLTRHRPTLRGMKGQHMPQMSIMFAMANGDKPPTIPNLPNPMAQLMDKCFDYVPEKRPSIIEIRKKMEYLCKFVKTAAPLIPRRQTKQPKPIEQSSSDVFVDDKSSSPRKRMEADSSADTVTLTRVEPNSSADDIIPPAQTAANIDFDIGGPIQKRDRTSQSLSIFASPERPNLMQQVSSPATESPTTYQQVQTPNRLAESPYATMGRVSSRGHNQEPEYEELEYVSEDLLSDKEDVLQKQQEIYRVIEDLMTGISNFPTAQGNSPYLISDLEPELQPILPNENNPQSMDLYRQYTAVCEEVLRARREYSELVEENMKLNNEMAIDRDKVNKQADLNHSCVRLNRLKENLLSELQTLELEYKNLRDENLPLVTS